MAAFTLSVPLTELRIQSLFELKLRELAHLKEEAHNHLRKLNLLKLRYMDWFNNRHQTFVDSLQFIYMSIQQRVTDETATIENFRMCHEVTNKIPQKGIPVERCVIILGEFLEFWDQLLKLHKEGQDFHQKIGDYSKGVTKMCDPRLNNSVDQLQEKLNKEMDEKFNFLTINHTTDHLFTYRVAQHDDIFHGLLSYIPYLLKTSSTICFLCTKMLLEKE